VVPTVTTERPRVDAFPTHDIGGYRVRGGDPRTAGASVVAGGGINFSVFAETALSVSLVLFANGKAEPTATLAIPEEFRTGRIFAMVVFDLDPDTIEYGFTLDPAPPGAPEVILADPYATRMAWRPVWGQPPEDRPLYPYRCALAASDFDWGEDRPPLIPLTDLVIYEANVRSFTAADPQSQHPGTFAGLASRVDYLVELGVNCVELLPIFEFDELDLPRSNPETGEPLRNLWGYNTMGFFAPKAALAGTGPLGLQADELKTTIKHLHAAGIEVLLDVVFNHTAEGNEQGPTASFRGLANEVFYMLDQQGNYLNFSGTGNTVNANHPIVRHFILDCLRYWVSEFHIDGFRFDLASILDRAPDGSPLANPPVIEMLASDPILRDRKLIAEAWDAGGLYQVGTFPAYGRWMEWNGRFRDCVRRFLKGDNAQVGELATRIVGSPDLYFGRGPTASVNFVTSHDGFTLADLVTYQRRHNTANGEQNQDGNATEHNWNHGHEGPSEDPAIVQLRARQVKNALVLLMISHGVPMLLAGDEVGRTQRGNNNAYCQDTELSYFDWSLPQTNAELFRFTQLLILLRKQLPLLRPQYHPGQHGPQLAPTLVSWHGRHPGQPDWSKSSQLLVMMLGDSQSLSDVAADCPLLVALNSGWWTESVALPDPGAGRQWHRMVLASEPAGADIYELSAAPVVADPAAFLLTDRTSAVLISRLISR